MATAAPPTPADKALKRVLAISALDGWSLVLLAGAGVLLTLIFGGLLGAAVSLLILAAGIMELRGRHLLRKREAAAGVKLLVRAQLFLLGVILAYCARCLASFDAGYLQDQVIPQVRQNLLSSFGVSLDEYLQSVGVKANELVPWVHKMFLFLYGGVALVSLLYQGGLALYYRRKTALVAEALGAPHQERWHRPPVLPPPSAPVYTLRRAGGAPGHWLPQDIIVKKRDDGTLTREEIEFFARGVGDGRFADYQASALLMAICWRGLTAQETAWLTEAMMRSGEVINLADLAGAKVDKHSTGGVGDKVSLLLAPLAAACGLKVPMMSGRGLGHTGGTLDKVEAIPGFRVALGALELRLVLDRVGCAIFGQTAQFVPADRKLYALRDVTGTVESIPLICASIMSKKLAEGIDALVLDVKFGRGAFLKPKERAFELARALVALGQASGKPVRALLTAMDQPLGRAVGHTTEVIEAIEALKGRGPADLLELTYALTGHMLLLGGAATDEMDARKKMALAIGSGAALRKFQEMCAAQGGDARVTDDYRLLPTAKIIREVQAPDGTAGFIGEVDALKVAHAVMVLGGARAAVSEKIDHAVGVADLVKIGEPVAPGSRLCTLHANDEIRGARAEALIREAIGFTPGEPRLEPLVQDLIQ